MTHLQRAVESLGGPAQLARTLGVTHQAVCSWITAGHAPPRRAVEISRLAEIPALWLVNEDYRPRALDIVNTGVPAAGE